MLRSVLLILAGCVANFSGIHDAAAQFPIKIPKIPKAEKTAQATPSKTESTKTEPSMTPMAIRSDGQPTIVKDSVQVTAFTFSNYRKKSDTWSWVPKIKFSVNGPIESG